MSSGPKPDPGRSRSPSDSTSPSLLDRVRAQRPEAWRRLVKLYGPMLYVWARQAGLQPSDAADVVQDVFVAVATHVAGFHGDRPGNTFRGWLWTIARNKIHDHFRRRQGQAQAQGGTDAQQRLAQIPDPGASAAAPETPQGESRETPEAGAQPSTVWIDREALDLVRAEFEERTWTAFIRSAIDGLRSADIADELGMTKRAVRQAKYRVLRRLRQELAGLLD